LLIRKTKGVKEVKSNFSLTIENTYSKCFFSGFGSGFSKEFED